MSAPLCAVVGDSFSGWAANPYPPPVNGYWYNYAIRDLGWRLGNVVANPGAGYAKRGDYGTFAEALRAHPINPATNFALVQGGLNDSPLDPSVVPAGVADVLATLRQQAPGIVPVVVGAFMPFPDHLVGPNQIRVARAIGDYNAIGNTRYMIGFMCSFQTGPDGVHPSATGHQQIGDWVAWHLANGLDNGTPLHQDPVNGWYVP